ncbi:DUF6221 family protein [Nonomuraea sp. CA-218870]|uniref:DUF6221 family protein n=1 Tax=Nonomuraea sp. CA-218870 TaxID=3239998 RepID=UPI003D8F959C
MKDRLTYWRPLMMNELVAFCEGRLAEAERWALESIETMPGRATTWRAIKVRDDAEDHLGGWMLCSTNGIAHVLGAGSYDDDGKPLGFDRGTVEHIAANDPASVLRDIETDRKLIARYKAAVKSHEEALKALQDARKAGAEPGELGVAGEDLAAAHARASAYLTVLEDRAARFFDHPDYQPHWRQP